MLYCAGVGGDGMEWGVNYTICLFGFNSPFRFLLVFRPASASASVGGYDMMQHNKIRCVKGHSTVASENYRLRYRKLQMALTMGGL